LKNDHDIVDGAPASRFMNHLIETIKSGQLIQTGLEKEIKNARDFH
jgi:pyruvate/2-oxoglutarate dehydrogenase complex dihydrolipoamide acyltransferase (E2) component